MATWDDWREKIGVIQNTFENYHRFRKHGHPSRPLHPVHRDTVRRLAAVYARLK